jgi:hypothetical protein
VGGKKEKNGWKDKESYNENEKKKYGNRNETKKEEERLTTHMKR